ncbi:MAG: hypothetical protein P8H17_03310 [Flavobacteriales bacterium]|nr:hypothetical protein [Flavobacteriales bacterium]|tara:strand:+ start:7 stop:387 length:381 start_codon:yes stop_codon:yes gene_type:complete
MKKTILKISSILLAVFFVSTVFTSCEKEKDTIGIIKVVNSNGDPMSGVTVVLDQTNTDPGTDPIENLTQTKETDASGRAEFIYKYEAILDITVSKTSGNDTYEGNGIIRLLTGKTEQVTIEAVVTP